MVGFPYHAAELYFGKIARKHNLAICENDKDIQLIDKINMGDNRLIDQDTGEILSEEEMREFDGDIEEPAFSEKEGTEDSPLINKLKAIFGNKLEVR